MSDHHHHHDHSGPIAIGDNAARVVVGLLIAIGVLVLAATVWLWPSAQSVDIPLPMQSAGGGAVSTEAGTVVMQDIGACGSPSIGRVFTDAPQAPRNAAYECQRSIVTIDSGPHEGKRTLLEIAEGPGQPKLSAGDHLRIVRQSDPSGQPMYSFDDYARGFPLSVIAIVFAVVIIAVARWRGLRALLGLVFAFGVLVIFLLPALLDGKPAIPVALVSGALILYAVLYLAHGVNLRTSSALLGTLTSMLLAAVLSWVALEMTHLTGLSEEQNTNVATYLQHVSITGLLLAGFIIGSLGVLNDVTITQASAAFELAALDENATRRSIFTSAMRVGRDHIASTVYTLVLAYAGGALPLLLLFSVAGRSIRDVLTGDAVGIEIARSAVGGIALALSVPLTTAIAVMLARPFGHRRSVLTEGPPPVSAAKRRAGAARAGAGAKRPAADSARRSRPGAALLSDPTSGALQRIPTTGEYPARGTAGPGEPSYGDETIGESFARGTDMGEQPVYGAAGPAEPSRADGGIGEPYTRGTGAGERPSHNVTGTGGRPTYGTGAGEQPSRGAAGISSPSWGQPSSDDQRPRGMGAGESFAGGATGVGDQAARGAWGAGGPSPSGPAGGEEPPAPWSLRANPGPAGGPPETTVPRRPIPGVVPPTPGPVAPFDPWGSVPGGAQSHSDAEGDVPPPPWPPEPPPSGGGRHSKH